MKNKDKLLNYTLSVGFILLIVIFITSIILISRYVLADENALQQHVVSTKNLLDDIEKVEKTFENAEIIEVSSTNFNQKNTINYQKNIIEHSYLNIKENTSIISFKLNKEIKEINNILYLEYENLNEINEDEMILYNMNQKGIILELENNENSINKTNYIIVFNFEKQDTEKINFENILGKIILDNNKD